MSSETNVNPHPLGGNEEAAPRAQEDRRGRQVVDFETARERRERIAHEERQREPEIPREGVHAKSDREMDIVSRISQYGMGHQLIERTERAP